MGKESKMVAETKDKALDIAKIYLECDCGHGMIEISQFSDGIVFIGYKEDGWHTRYHPVRYSIKRFFENLWTVISGKEYEHYSILLQGYEVEALKKAINTLEAKDIQ